MKHAFTIFIIFLAAGALISILAIVFNLKSFGSSLPKGEGGIFLSENGKIFKKVSATSGLEITSVLFSKIYPRRVYIGTKKYGLWISEDAGNTFSQVSPRTLNIDVYDIFENTEGNVYLAVYGNKRGSVIFLPATPVGIEENKSREIYFSLIERFGVFGITAQNGTLVIISSDGGVYASHNNGKSWELKSRLPDEGLLKLAAKKNSGTIWVLTSENRILRSDNLGKEWHDVSPQKKLFAVPRINNIFYDQRSGALVVSSDKIYKSVDEGNSWEALNLLLPPDQIPISAAGINPDNAQMIYAGSGNILYKSIDGGTSWSFIKLPISKNISTISFEPNDPRITIIGTSR